MGDILLYKINPLKFAEQPIQNPLCITNFVFHPFLQMFLKHFFHLASFTYIKSTR